MANETKTIPGYKIDFKTNTLIMNYKFSKEAMKYGTAEYNLRKAILADFPELKTVIQSGRTKKSTSKTKRLTYDNMRIYIATTDDRESLFAEFDNVILKSKSAKSPYKYVRDWFEAKFPDYDAYKVSETSDDAENKDTADETAPILKKASGF